MKKVLSLLSAIAVILSFAVINVSAASGKSSMSFSKKQVNVGDSVTVTVNISASEKIYGIEFVLNYDPDILQFVSGDDCSGGAGVISVAAGNTSSSASKSFNFKALKAGSCYVSTADMSCVNIDEEIISVANQGANLTVKDASLSGNANLKSLSLSDGTLSPSFSSSKTSYTATVSNDVTSCKIYATASDSDAKVKVEGGNSLKVGKNTCTVTVTAANGTQKVYKIAITRKAEAAESSQTSSEDDTSSEDTSSDETASGEPGSLETEIDGAVYTVAVSLENVALPGGFTEKKVDFNGNEVSVAVDSGENYTIYYLGTADSKTLEPYTYDYLTNTFSKLQYLKQGENFYIFAEIPDGFTLPEGYYTTNTQISDFNVGCYSSSEQELSSFYYLYCFSGSEYGFYRYDSVENVLQRYPEMEMVSALASLEDNTEEAGFIGRFNSLTTNAKIVVIGILLVILGILALIILFIIKLFHRRNEAEFVSNLGYTEDFDSIDYSSAFSLENSEGFITDDSETDEELILENEVRSENEIESDYITEEENEDKL